MPMFPPHAEQLKCDRFARAVLLLKRIGENSLLAHSLGGHRHRAEA
jgi:hypothetical protein